MPIKPPGSDWDSNNCIVSAGYTFCEILGRCIRVWEEACQIPNNCLTWDDGCNTCGVNQGKITMCTEMFCFAQGTPECLVYAPDQEVSIEPWLIDPPVINPFIGDGH